MTRSHSTKQQRFKPRLFPAEPLCLLGTPRGLTNPPAFRGRQHPLGIEKISYLLSVKILSGAVGGFAVVVWGSLFYLVL